MPELPGHRQRVSSPARSNTLGSRMSKTLEENFRDWQGDAIGYGYGSGEPHTVPALKRFLELCPDEGGYDYAILERELTGAVAWLLIAVLARSDIIEYGSSPRFAWLTPRGKALKAFVASKSADDLVEITTGYTEDYVHCYPD